MLNLSSGKSFKIVYGQSANYQNLYYEIQKDIEHSADAICSYCGSKCFKRHSYYSRYFFNCAEDIQNSNKIQVTVLECTCENCPHRFQTVLPDWICPFSPFSYPFIFAFLDSFYNDLDQNISAAARLFGISRRQVRFLISRFNQDQFEMRQTSSAQESAFQSESMIHSLNDCPVLLLFLLFEFMFKTSRAFMMRHFRPACRWSFIRCSWLGAKPNKPDSCEYRSPG